MKGEKYMSETHTHIRVQKPEPGDLIRKMIELLEVVDIYPCTL